MRQGLLRGLALCALAVLTLAPGATAGASGAITADGTPSVATPPTDAAGLRQAWDRAVTAAAPGAADEEAAPTTTTTVGRRAAAAVSPTLTVTPGAALISGQQVAVRGTGYPANSEVVLVECPVGATPAFTCDLRTILVTGADASGAVDESFVVHRTIQPSAGRLDCSTTASTCDLVAADQGANVLARASLGFDASAPRPDPQVTLTPAADLIDGQSVTVAGHGFLSSDRIVISQCAVDDPYCSSGFTNVQADAGGGFSQAVTVRLRVGDGTGGATNCIAVDCILRVASSTDIEYSVDTSLAFDPDQPLPPDPTVTVTPASGLHHDQTVTIAGAGFDAGFAEISECGLPNIGFCADFLTDIQIDSSGAFSITAKVSRLVSVFSIDTNDQSVVDCAVEACSVDVDAFGGGPVPFSLHASTPISFDASVPPPPLPVVTVTPTTNLPYRAQLAVHGTGYQPGEPVNAEFCAESAQTGSCGFSGSFATADATGTVDLTVGVKRRLFVEDEDEPSGTVDCIDPGTECSVQVFGQRSYERSKVVITFDPNSQVPPPPVVTVTPNQDLAYHQGVTVTGSGFTPGFVAVQQCGRADTDDGSFTFCPNFTPFQADAAGRISGTVPVDRVLAEGPGLSIDCATAPVPCTLVVGSGDPDESVTITLGFDPSTQPPPPAAITVTPGAHLFDGQHVTVAGRNFVPGTQVGITECKAGATVIADTCDIGKVHAVTVGADGTFSTRFVTESVLGTADGPVDCTGAPNACVVAVANAPARQDFASAPLSFDPPELAVLGVGVTEGTGGMTMAPVRVSLSKSDRNPIVVHWVATAETASPGTDYSSMRGTLTIPAGATEAMIDASVVADPIDEPTETFRIRVTDALGTRVVDRVGTVTIHDDDAAPSVVVHDARRREDHGEAHAEVLLSAPSGRTVIVHYVTHHGSARAGSDYVRKDSRLIFRPGEVRHLVRVQLVNDRVHEPTESFRVELDRVEQGTIADGAATVTVTDDD